MAAALALTVKDAAAQVGAPAEVDAGSSFEVSFSGPATQGDFVAIDRSGAADRDYGPYVYVGKASGDVGAMRTKVTACETGRPTGASL